MKAADDCVAKKYNINQDGVGYVTMCQRVCVP